MPKRLDFLSYVIICINYFFIFFCTYSKSQKTTKLHYWFKSYSIFYWQKMCIHIINYFFYFLFVFTISRNLLTKKPTSKIFHEGNFFKQSKPIAVLGHICLKIDTQKKKRKNMFFGVVDGSWSRWAWLWPFILVTGDRWQVTGDRWQVTGDRWEVTGDRWHMTHDT